MQKENLQNKAGQVKRNPSRDNKNINQGQNYEKRVDNKDHSHRDVEADKKKFSGNESSVDGSGVSDSTGNNPDYGHSGKTQQNAAGKNAGNLQQAESQDIQESDKKQNTNDTGYDVNKQFDDDEDFGSSTRQ